jgi:hypothetical protein
VAIEDLVSSCAGALAGAAIGAGVVGASLRTMLAAAVGHQFNKELEAHKAGLAASVATEVERLRSDAADDLAAQRERHERELEGRREALNRDIEAQRQAAAKQLEDFRGKSSADLESIKASLTVAARLRTAAEEKRAQVAGEVLVACLKFLDALESAVTLAAIGDAPPGAPAEVQIERTVAARRDIVEAEAKQFAAAWILAETHLPDAVTSQVEQIWKQWLEIHAVQMTWLASLGTPDSTQYYLRAIGPHPERNLAATRTATKDCLRRLVMTAEMDAPSRA